MANTFRLKRSAVQNKVPTTGDLQLGELALNTFDGKLYTKKDNGTASIVEIGGAGAGVSSFSAGSTGLTPSTATTGAVTLAGTLAVANGGTGVTTSTGSGSVVLSTSPSLTTPLLGTPTSGTLTNCTGYTFANLASKPTTVSGYGITDAPTFSGNNAFTGANTFTNATGQTFRQAATQDGILLRGRAGGTTSLSVEITPGTLTASRTLTAPDVSGTIITTGDTSTVTNTMLAGSIANAKLANSTISGVALGGTLNALTLGTGLTGTSYNGSAAVTAAVSYGTTAGTACQGNDSRLSDTRNTTNSLTFNNGGAGGASGSTFNGGSALTVSYNTVGAPSTTGANASGSWGISVTGSSASCTGNAATATTASNVSASADQAIVNQNNGNAATWYGRILSKNSTNDKAAFLGTYGTIAGVFAHNNALNAWADLYVNTVDGSGGGTVRMPSSVLINGSQALHAGNYTSYSPSLTGSGASGSWGISVTGSSASCTGNAATVTNGVYTTGAQSIGGVKTFSNGITLAQGQPLTFSGWGESHSIYVTDVTGGGNGNTRWVFEATDDFAFNQGWEFRSKRYDGVTANRFYIPGDGSTPTANGNTILHAGNYNSYAPTLTGTGASGTWGINITGSSASCTGNAATATTASNLSGFTNSNSGNPIVGADALTNNGVGYVNSISLLGQADGALYGQAYNSSWVHQIFGDYRTGQIAVRGRNNGTWQAWRNVLDSSNYVNYSPSLTGLNASGTWGISISGNAATASAVAFANVTSKPTTLSGYGITDGASNVANGCITLNNQTISNNYTFTAGQNGVSAGPITISVGATVTVTSGCGWSIV